MWFADVFCVLWSSLSANCWLNTLCESANLIRFRPRSNRFRIRRWFEIVRMDDFESNNYRTISNRMISIEQFEIIFVLQRLRRHNSVFACQRIMECVAAVASINGSPCNLPVRSSKRCMRRWHDYSSSRNKHTCYVILLFLPCSVQFGASSPHKNSTLRRSFCLH